MLTDTTESEPSKRTLPITDSSKSAQNKRWLNWSTTRPEKKKKKSSTKYTEVEFFFIKYTVFYHSYSSDKDDKENTGLETKEQNIVTAA